ncbi:hypothetical protein ECG_00537 [Echinococcus granulosus]|nr:hypothetical protein ECG_00537 [Echinococcus granulosus]
MQSRCVEAVGTFFSCLLPLLGVFVTGQIPLQLRPMKCNKRTDFNALCQSACHDILVSEFGFCGESIQFTARHYNLKELTISLGSIFNHNAREEERHWRERRSDFKRRSDVKINYTLAIIDEDYTIQYLVFFNDVKPLAFDWKLHGHHDVIDLWHGLKQYSKPIRLRKQMWRVVLFEFINRSDFPLRKPLPPLRLDYTADLNSLGGTIIAVGYYCVTVNVQ